MNRFQKLQNELPIKLEIIVRDSHWLINGKTYAECGFVERYYFDLYLNFHRIKFKNKQLKNI
jgi:hypothetical protein